MDKIVKLTVLMYSYYNSHPGVQGENIDEKIVIHDSNTNTKYNRTNLMKKIHKTYYVGL